MDIMQDTFALISAFINEEQCDKAAAKLCAQFGGEENTLCKTDDKLLSSFKRNLALLVQKTWVESTDVALKDSVLYRLEQFRKTDILWCESYEPFLSLIRDAVYLMFGKESRESGFDEYAMRIDPEFGAFWHFIASLPARPAWTEDKYHKAIDCGMLFLANY